MSFDAADRPLRRRRVAASTVLLLLLAAGLACEREQRRFHEAEPAARLPDGVPMTALEPGQPREPRFTGAYDPRLAGQYEENAWAIGEGKRYFTWFNCVGCHAHGGGGMGPPLIDETWIYGSEPAQIYSTIVEGRPNGMPSFRGRIPNQQVWQLVAYVRSMSALVPKDARPGRSDALYPRPPEVLMPPARPHPEGARR